MKQSRSRFGAVALALIVVIATFAIALPVSAQDSNVTEIDSCTVIDEPGTYVLTADIEDSDAETCLRVEDGTNDVTIDGDGHTIDGVDGQPADGIYVGRSSFEGNDTTDVTVENVVLTDWSRAIVYNNVENSTIRENEISSNGIGVVTLDASTNIEIADNTVTGNSKGIVTIGGRATITDTVASNEIDYRGVAYTEGGSPDNSAENLTLDTATVSFEDEIDQIVSNYDETVLDLSAVESPPADPDGLSNIGQYVEANATDNMEGTFALDVHYDDEDLDGVDEDSLRLYQFTDGEWTEVDDSSVDTDANTVSAEFDDPAAFGDGTVLAPLGQADGSDGGDGNPVDIGTKDIEIDLGDVTIADFDLDGPGLSDEHIDHRTYSVGAFDVEIDGFDLTIGDTDYRIGHVTIDVEPFDVILENVTLGDGK